MQTIWYILLVVFMLGVLCLVVINYKSECARKNWVMRAVVLLTASIFLAVLFSTRPMRLISDLALYGNPGKFASIESPAAGVPEQDKAAALEFLKQEHQKAIEEINIRIVQEDSWFHYKFLLVGGLLALLLGKLVLGDKVTPSMWMEYLSEPKVMCITLALAAIVELAIDIHIRNNIMVVQQLGLWIANYVEPALLHKAFDPDNAAGFLPWEQFLRNTAAGNAMHSDDWYGFIFYPHLHFLTWVIYISYLGFFQTFAINNNMRRTSSPSVDTGATGSASLVESAPAGNPAESAGDSPREWFVLAGFALVHISLAAFTGIAHFTPGAFEFKIFPWDDYLWLGSLSGVSYFLLFWVFLTLLSLPYLALLLFPSKPRLRDPTLEDAACAGKVITQ